MSRVYNFSAGPAMMPESVLRRAADEMLDYNGSGMSVMEMSHRSKQYDEILKNVEASMRRVMKIPDNYKVLFLQGGATLQFSAVAMNLMARCGRADYAVTGDFSKKAMKCASELGTVNIACDGKPYKAIPAQSELTLDPGASYFHYCHNNTIYGTAWQYVPQTGDVPLVCDMSSSILSEPVDVSKYGVIYAGAQKNMGPAGLTLVIVRDDLLATPLLPGTPALLSYAEQAKNDSMINTPATYGIYLLGLVLDWIEAEGGLTAMQKLNRDKAALLYETLEACPAFTLPVEKGSRSIMNVVFRTESDEKDAEFIKGAAARGLLTLKGHRNAGGMRASIYNAMPVEGIKALCAYIKKF